MSTQSKSKAPYIIGAIVAIALISAVVPYKAWDYAVFPDRYCVEGQVASIDGRNLKVNIDTAMGENQMPQSLGAFVVLEGDVPDYCREGQSVIISIPSGSSLLQKIGKNVEVQFYRDTNLLMGLIVPLVAPVQVGAPSMILKDINLNGTLLVYYETGDR
ncbi:MAG: hypothetical protein IJI68_02680 [Eggerthellaceae bacterium]|nr:hypothetical protein [Eggerthellaceae bacterium]